MQLQGPTTLPIQDELEVIAQLLPLHDARVLDLGCGAAEKTRQLAEQGGVVEIVAAEVDQLQHQKNLQISDLPKVRFASFPAQAIDAPDDSFDAVVMFKSLHHVPIADMDAALGEIHRVLKPGGLAYISEPVFAGAFNEIVRMFHDESQVRRAAFLALQRAVATGKLELAAEHFFMNERKLKSFAQFEQGILSATHTEHDVSPELLDQVRIKFERHASDQGYVFEIPNRVDLLRKAVA